MRRALAWAAALLLFGAAVEFAAGFLRFAGSLPRAPDPGLAEVEAAAVLTGGSGRIRAGLDALAAAPGAVLFVSGVHEGADAERLIARLGRDPAPLRDRVVLGRAAADTRGNAEETARWMAERGFSRLALVTSAYHMPRAVAGVPPRHAGRHAGPPAGRHRQRESRRLVAQLGRRAAPRRRIREIPARAFAPVTRVLLRSLAFDIGFYGGSAARPPCAP